MPYKTCPECNQKSGVRTKICKCGHNFYGPSTKMQEGIFGTWMFDRPKGLPPIEMPPEIPNGKLSLQEIKEWVSYEGLGECIVGYFKPSQIEDVKLAKLWGVARKTMQAILKYLYEES